MTPHAMAGRLLPVLVVLLLSLPAAADTLQGRVVRMADGDTVVVLTDKVQHKIRLMGIDAPERKQAYGSVSTKHLSELVDGKTGTLPRHFLTDGASLPVVRLMLIPCTEGAR